MSRSHPAARRAIVAAAAILCLASGGCGDDDDPSAFERQEERVMAELTAQEEALSAEALQALARADEIAAARAEGLEDALAAIVAGARADPDLDLDREARTAIDAETDLAMLEVVGAYEAERDVARAAGAPDPPVDAARDAATDRLRDVADAAHAEIDALEEGRGAVSG